MGLRQFFLFRESRGYGNRISRQGESLPEMGLRHFFLVRESFGNGFAPFFVYVSPT
jgi:hypothetical protein